MGSEMGSSFDLMKFIATNFKQKYFIFSKFSYRFVNLVREIYLLLAVTLKMNGVQEILRLT